MGEAKAVHTFSTVNRLMATYPEFRFAYSQPASYEAVGRRAPALLDATRRRMKSGQWEATGVLHVESDTLLACGEALARSFTLGQAWFQAERGEPAKLTWLPDVFGYAGCLPQLIRLAGAEWFFTTKMTWNAINRFPHSSFIWRGNDGSEVVAHVTQGVGYNNDVRLAQLRQNADGHRQADVHPELLHPSGFGDGGGGPTAEMLERARRIGALHETPAVAWGQPEAFFARLARRRRDLPVWQGECYLEYHRGTFTSHGDLKAAFRGLERALQAREAVAVVRGRAPDLGAVWRRLVFAQFHDYIPGSSVPEVYAEGGAELRELAAKQLAAAGEELTGKRGAPAWFNTLPVPWRGWVKDARDQACWLELPPLSGGAGDGAKVPPPVRASGRRLRNERVEAVIGVDGGLASLVVDGRQVELMPGAGVPHVGPDRPAHYDAWDIDRQALDLLRPWPGRPRVKLGSVTEAEAVVEVTWPRREKSSLVTRYRLEAGASCLRIEVEADWQEAETLLRLPFATGYHGQLARYGSPFGSTLRSAHTGATTADAQWEVPGSRWAAISHDGERDGLWLATEAKYGFSARDGILAVTLLRSPRMTGFEAKGIASPRVLVREPSASAYSDQGRALIRLAVGRHDATAPRDEQPAVLTETLFTPPLAYSGEAVAAPAGYAGLDGGPTLVPVWAVPVDGEGRWILRLHEVAGQAGEARLPLAKGWRTRPVDLLQRPLGRRFGRTGTFAYRPYQIISLLIERG
jgi:alpha-mannosidase